jgi:hypothetical protein
MFFQFLQAFSHSVFQCLLFMMTKWLLKGSGWFKQASSCLWWRAWLLTHFIIIIIYASWPFWVFAFAARFEQMTSSACIFSETKECTRKFGESLLIWIIWMLFLQVCSEKSLPDPFFPHSPPIINLHEDKFLALSSHMPSGWWHIACGGYHLPEGMT